MPMYVCQILVFRIHTTAILEIYMCGEI